MTTKIFVGSLPSGCKPEELRRLFEAFGAVTECDVMNRCGFVHMETSEMAAAAIEALNATEFKGETINVEPGRIRDRNQKGNGCPIQAGAGGGPGRRNRMGRGGPPGIKFNGIDENTTKDALQLCSAVFEEMNKLLNPEPVQNMPRRGGGGNMPLPKNFGPNQIPGGGANRQGRPNNRNRSRSNRNNSRGGEPKAQPNANQGPAPRPQGNANRAHSQGNAKPGPNQGNARREGQNQGNGPRNQGNNNNARAPQQRNAGPVRNEPGRQHRNNAPYNRGRADNNAGPRNSNAQFSEDVPIYQSARSFANNLASSSSQIEGRWPNTGSLNGAGDMNPMSRNFDEDVPVNNFNDESSAPRNNSQGFNNLGNLSNLNSMRSQGLTNHGNFGNNLGGGGGGGGSGTGNDRYQNSGNDRFQSGSNGGGNNYGMGNQDRRGFALPERQMYNDNQKFGSMNQDMRGGNSQLGGLNSQGSMGGGNRNMGFGGNSGRQQSNSDNRGLGNSSSMNGGGGNGMFTRRNNTGGGLDNGGNNRMRNDFNDNNRGSNFSSGNFSSGFSGNNRGSIGSGGNSNLGSSGFSSNNRAMGGGNFGNTGNNGNNNNRNFGGGNNNQMSSLNFQKDFPPLSSGQNMNNRNGPRQNMMSNRRY